MRRVRLILALAAAALIAAVGVAHGFGTINTLGQAAQHEKITRAGLWCKATTHPRNCFRDWSITQLAGQGGSFGAVGAPDSDQVFDAAAHCDDSDFLAIFPDYKQKRAAATAALMNCRNYARKYLLNAIKAAKNMLDSAGRLKKSEVEIPAGCTFTGGFSGDAKCETLEGFGRALHTVEDFYSHTNWADQSDPNQLQGVENPPGLNQGGLTSLFDWDATPSIPEALSGGCFDPVPPDECVQDQRVTHDTINKDEGTIDPRTGATSDPKTPRGKILNNFAAAVSGAVRDTRRQWVWFSRRLIGTYGERKGHLMICALTHDHPWEECRLKLTLTGTQTVKWSTDVTTAGICGGHSVGSGSTTVKFKTDDPVYTSPVDLIPPEGEEEAIGVDLPSTGKFNSGGTLNVTSNGECAGGNGKPIPPDCGAKTAKLPLNVISKKENQITLRNAGAAPEDPYHNCPNAGIARTQIGPDDTELDDDDLFDPDMGKIIVKGKGRKVATQTYDDATTHGTTTVTLSIDWTLTIEKVDQKDEKP
jgi:hypothetical protein